METGSSNGSSRSWTSSSGTEGPEAPIPPCQPPVFGAAGAWGPVPKVGPRACCPPIVLEDTSAPFLALDCAVYIGLFAQRFNQLVAPALVIALRVVVLRVLPHGPSKMALAQRDDLIETLGSDGENESLRVRIQVGAASRELHGLHRPERTPVRMPEVGRRPRPCPLSILRNRSRFGSADFWHRRASSLRLAHSAGDKPARATVRSPVA